MKTRKNNAYVRCEKNFCEKFYFNMLEKKIKNALKKLKITKKKVYTLKEKENLIRQCKKGYCNPGCKGTLFEPGKTLPKELINEIKNRKDLKTKKLREEVLRITRKMRKHIFKNKTNVLGKDGFYKGILPETKKDYKKKGAISGCSV